MTQIVAITGRAGSGKSTAAEVLIAAGWARVKFAAPLKNMTRQFLTDAGVPADQIERCIEGDLKEAPLDELGGRTPRHVMQTLGTEWGRGCIAPDLWVDLARREILRQVAAGRSVVVDDCRFPNEAAAIRAIGGMVLELRGRGGIAGGHSSEAGLQGDIVYQNSGTRAELEGFVRYVFADLGKV